VEQLPDQVQFSEGWYEPVRVHHLRLERVVESEHQKVLAQTSMELLALEPEALVHSEPADLP